MELLRGEDKEEVDDDKTVLSMVSHEKKNLLLSIESWLFNRDPYNGLL